MTAQIELLIADDHALLRTGMAALLGDESDITVVGEASTAEETIELTRSLSPDVLLLDIHMPGGGLRAARTILSDKEPPKIVVLSVCDDAQHLRTALQMGVSGYVTKRSADEVAVQAIRDAHAGRRYVDPLLSDIVVAEIVGPSEAAGAALRDLTPRMQEVLRLVAWGFTNEQIAYRLSITVKTVEAHRSSAMRRLGLSDRAEVVQYGYHAGLLDEPPGDVPPRPGKTG